MVKSKPVQQISDRLGKKWQNPSVIALMKQRALPNETPQETIRRLARAMVADAKTHGWSGAPFDPEVLAELQGIEVACADGDIRAEARLMPLPGRRLRIDYAIDAPETRRRFSICHEISHTFFPDCFEQVQFRRENQNHDPVHAQLEQLCHIGAGELLLPIEEFVEAMAGREPSFAVADELAPMFNSSKEACLRRMVDVSGVPCCLVWASARLKPTEQRHAGPEFDFGLPAPRLKLRVDYRCPSSNWQEKYLPPHKSVPDSSQLYSLLEGGLIVDAQEDWTSLGFGQVHVHAIWSNHSEPDARGVLILLKK